MLEILAVAAAKAITLLGVVIPFRPRPSSSAEKLRAPVIQKSGTRRPVVSKRKSHSAEQAFSQPSKTLTATEHFEKVGAVITAAIRSSRIAAEAHEAARIQLEVVEFSIDRILDEVAAVMTLTPEMAAIRKPIPVVVPVRRAA